VPRLQNDTFAKRRVGEAASAAPKKAPKIGGMPREKTLDKMA